MFATILITITSYSLILSSIKLYIDVANRKDNNDILDGDFSKNQKKFLQKFCFLISEYIKHNNISEGSLNNICICDNSSNILILNVDFQRTCDFISVKCFNGLNSKKLYLKFYKNTENKKIIPWEAITVSETNPKLAPVKNQNRNIIYPKPITP